MYSNDIDEAFDQLKRLGQDLQENGFLTDLEKSLSEADERNLQEPKSHSKLRTKLLVDIADQKPFTLLRIGDGEGNVLFWHDRKQISAELAKICMDRIWTVMFGKNHGSEENWNMLSEGLTAATSNADYLGFPTTKQLEAALTAVQAGDRQILDIRGTTGVIAACDWVHNNRQKLNETVVYTNWHVHISLYQFYSDLVRQAGNLSLITCYPELISGLHQKCNVSKGDIWLIPHQAFNIKGTPASIHYPNRFDEICVDLASTNRKGQLFFVGAGLVGKLYCDVIKQAGGMAIDVGSMMDVWMGIGVRPYQSPEFVEKNQIIK